MPFSRNKKIIFNYALLSYYFDFWRCGTWYLLSLSSWSFVIVVCLFLAVPWICLQFVTVVFPDHTHLLYSSNLLFIYYFRDPNQPMPVGVDWPEFTSDGQQYLHITRNMSSGSVKRHLIGGRLHLWNKVIPPLLRTLFCCLEACQDGPYGGVGWTSTPP